jgi:hypothetical protein
MYQMNPLWASVEAEVYGDIQPAKPRPARRRLLAGSAWRAGSLEVGGNGFPATGVARDHQRVQA